MNTFSLSKQSMLDREMHLSDSLQSKVLLPSCLPRASSCPTSEFALGAERGLAQELDWSKCRHKGLDSLARCRSTVGSNTCS